ncbi:MAG: hypothetical protein IPI40_06995 [Betaproteobacteria bacterium]|nr:hypothetical protein [Betaproteobacteria bacterium]
MVHLSRLFLLCILGCGGLLLALPAAAAAPAGNDTCLMCHADKDARNGQGQPIAVDPARFKASVHGEMQLTCVMCHADVADGKVPHADKLKPVDCKGCHEKAVAEYRGTVHGKARADGRTLAASCTDCHGTHDIRRAKDPASPTNHVNLEATCSKCHGSDAYVEKAKLPGGNVGKQYHDSVHGKLLAGKGPERQTGPECTDCHGTHDIRAKDDPQSRVHRARVPETCGSCHDAIRAQFTGGQHGKLRQQGMTGAPGCNDCHSAHDIQRHDLPRFQLEAIKQCGNCHQDFIATYRDTFHGKVTNLGYTQVATCAACHGAHEMLPASDPASKVSAGNRLKTCQACHADASASFASWDPHANKHDRARSPLYYWAARFMEILLAGVFGFFGIHTVFWFYRSLRVRLAAGRAHGEKR